VSVASDHDGSPLLLMSRLASHTVNLEADPRASLLLAETGKGDPLARPRLTVIGRVERAQGPRIRARFLARHPKAALYADFPDFSFFRLTMQGGHLNGGFARAAGVTGSALRTPLEGTEGLIAAEEGALDLVNREHAEDLRQCATRLCGAPDGPWRAIGLDPEGLDLSAGDRTARISFPARVEGEKELRRILGDLALRARATPKSTRNVPGTHGAGVLTAKLQGR
jgi:putative heme iron utilization protein